MLMTKIGVTNNGCGGVHLLAGHFDLHIAGYSAVSSEMRSSEYSENVARFAISHPYISIADLDDGYENNEVDIVGVDSVQIGASVGQLLIWNGSVWAAGSDVDFGTT